MLLDDEEVVILLDAEESVVLLNAEEKSQIKKYTIINPDDDANKNKTTINNWRRRAGIAATAPIGAGG